MFEMGGWKTVLQVAEHRNDEHLLRRIRGHDLFACEAKFHQSCRIKYVQDPTKWQSSNNKAKSKQPLTEHIHTMAFKKVCEKVNSEILENNNTLKRSELTAFYNLRLEDNGLKNPDYRGENLKIKLKKHFEEKLSFCSLGNFRTYIVYHADVSLEHVMRCCYELGCKDTIKEAGLQLHQVQVQLL